MDATRQTTRLLERLAGGDDAAADELVPLLYTELHQLARRYMAHEDRGHTLQPTALVNEAWMRLVGGQKQAWRNRSHFVAAAARAMRRVLIDAARRRKSDKRGGDQSPLPLEAALDLFQQHAPDLVELDDALARLEVIDPQLTRIVELRFFGGASNPEIAGALGVSTRTVERGWRTAQAWLAGELGDAEKKAD